MDKYIQHSQENRHQIKVLIDVGHPQAGITRNIGVHRSTHLPVDLMMGKAHKSVLLVLTD